MRILVFDGPGGASESTFPTDTVLIGRDRRYSGADIDLGADKSVSRKHATLANRDGLLWIEDLNSRNGTWLNGERLQHGSPRSLALGGVVRVGDTTIVAGSDRLLHICSGKLSILMESLPHYGYGLLHGGVPLVSGIVAWNRSDGERRSSRLRVQVANHGNVHEFEIEGISPGERRHIGGTEGMLDTRQLEAIAGLTPTRLMVDLDGIVGASQDVGLISSWEWPHCSQALPILAAYVHPDDLTIRRLLNRTADRIRTSEGIDLFERTEQGATGIAAKGLQAIFETLSEEFEVRYAPPRIQRDSASEMTYQAIRPPEQVLQGLAARSGEADCMDLALVFAAALESLGLAPFIVLCGDRTGIPEHAFIGCWGDSGVRFRPHIPQAELLEALNDDAAEVLEATGVCRDRYSLTFEEARVQARLSVHASNYVHAVDISSLRPPLGHVVPMRQSLEPLVSRAFWESDRLRGRKGVQLAETSHLLYGLVSAGGPLITQLLEIHGARLLELRSALDRAIPSGEGFGETQSTNNFARCEEEAKRNAKSSKVSRVRESDLLWAVLDSPSTELQRLLEDLDLPASDLRRSLEKLVPRPYVQTVPKAARRR